MLPIIEIHTGRELRCIATYAMVIPQLIPVHLMLGFRSYPTLSTQRHAAMGHRHL